jgi:hypothetical protein
MPELTASTETGISLGGNGGSVLPRISLPRLGDLRCDYSLRVQEGNPSSQGQCSGN